MTQRRPKLHMVRLTALVLLLALCVPWALPARAAESGSCGDNVTWQLSGGVLQLAGKGEMSNYSEEDPAPWSAYAEEITQVYVGSGITAIGSRAFDGCGDLVGVSLPETLEVIGDRSFRGCRKLASVVLPAGLKTLSDGAFEQCESLWSIRLPDGLKTIRNFAFYRCESLRAITVPESVIYFGMAVFAYCTSLTQVTLRCSLTELPDSTFYGCTGLKWVILPPGMQRLGEHTFYDCGELGTIYYGGSNGDELLDQIRQEEGAGGDVVVVTLPGDHDGSSYGTGEDSFEEDGTVSNEIVNTVENENGTVTVVVETSTTITENGEPVPVEELPEELPEDGDYGVITTENVRVEATVANEDGWQDLINTVRDLEENGADKLDITVNLPGSTVSGSDLGKLAGHNVQIVTDTGSIWDISSDNKRTDYQKGEYNLGIKVEQVENKKAPLNCDALYKVNFEGDVDFNATVGIHVGNARQLASLHQKVGSEYRLIQTVIVDADGTAWFDLAGTNRKSDFFISINEENADPDTASIPKSLYKEYGIDADGPTLMDAEGRYYEIVGTNSFMGLDIKTFTMYVAVAIVGVSLVVTIIMVLLNQRKKTRQRFGKAMDARKKAKGKPGAKAQKKPEPEEVVDMDALRLKVMQDLLDEQKRNNQNRSGGNN